MGSQHVGRFFGSNTWFLANHGQTGSNPIVPANVWSAAGLQGKVWSRRQVCANVFGLWVAICSPGHDELRACLSF
jgi:hypothetical protein